MHALCDFYFACAVAFDGYFRCKRKGVTSGIRTIKHSLIRRMFFAWIFWFYTMARVVANPAILSKIAKRISV